MCIPANEYIYKVGAFTNSSRASPHRPRFLPLAMGARYLARMSTMSRAQPHVTNEPPRAQRIQAVDIVRGAIMVLMALDHVRDFTIHNRTRPEDLANGTAALFATRWLTHFCAPTFALLAGVGIGILKNRGKPPAELSRYLLARGFWLLILELIITPVGWQFGFQLIPAFALVLWSLGWSMILMAALVHVPKKPLAVGSI